MDKFPTMRIVKIGIVVRDIEKAVKAYAGLFGIPVPPVRPARPAGPPPDAPEVPGGNIPGTIFRGKKGVDRIKTAVIPLNPIYIELAQPVDDFGPWHEFLEKHGQLGMGDMLSLIEKAQQAFDEQKAVELVEKLKKDSFTLDDFLEQFRQMKNMGSIQDILGMMPGMDAKKLSGVEVDERQMVRMEAIILSMTKAERNNPDILNASRRKRIARGSGTSIQDVNRLINQYEASRKMMKQMTGGKGKRRGRMQLPFF